MFRRSKNDGNQYIQVPLLETYSKSEKVSKYFSHAIFINESTDKYIKILMFFRYKIYKYIMYL